eukprot:TRINITY_DN1011_c0_g5_i1.p1 TRINITY_DN1011_c0_g5~~TRINITY_DN1011_c0_g5_i1.p1  ORF type:complete len:982 (+),score=75.04 TRINITY_DN1011_c0_g5_i1:223-3168(+)
MKRKLCTLFAMAIALTFVFHFDGLGQERKRVKINPQDRNEKNEIQLKSSAGGEMLIQFNLNSYDLIPVKGQNAYKIEGDNMGAILKKGAPDLPRFAQSISIPANAEMQVEVVSSEFIEVNQINIVPSKGNLTRNIDPRTVPYQYGEEYQKDSFYPSLLTQLNDPYILRSIRGQTLVIQPICYNPIKHTLRIYTNLVLKVKSTGKISTKNAISKTKSADGDQAFTEVYKKHFLNFTAPKVKYDALNDEPGKMLIICHDDFMDEMADFVAWKKQKGIPVEMVAVSTIGNAAAIKTYVRNYYNNNGLTYLLLVGDNAQVPASATTAGDSDNNYGFIVGNDHYIDIFVGRFSAETAAQVTTQVQRTIHYERDVTTADNWLASGVGIASDEGWNPSDAEHMNAIENDLEGYGYNIDRCYQEGGSANQLSNMLNAGRGIINYVGHGSNTGFASMVYTSNNVNALTNENRLPFIFDVACVNGNFTGITCFAEAWMRATNNGNPTGAIAICASTINQSWVPPMTAQNEMNDILVESYANNIRRTFAGLALNGMFRMVDVHGAGGENMLDTWTIFGDPSLQVRTHTPSAMQVNHSATVASNSNQFTVNTPVNDAWVSITMNGEILGTAKTNNGSAVVNFNPLPSSGTITVTVTAYNKIPHTANVVINGSAGDDVVANLTSDKTNIYEGESIHFTDLSSNNPSSWNWSFPGGTPVTSTSQNPSVTYSTEGTYSVSLTASNASSSDTKTVTEMITVSKELQQTYCEATSNGCSSYEYISRVVFEAIDNSTVCNGYSDFTAQSADVEAQQTYSLTVNVGRPYNGNAVSAWFDWNRDGDFEDAGEEYILTYSISGGVGTGLANITVPADAQLGRTRMRVRLTYNSDPVPCGNSSYGEIEDYTIMVVDGNERTRGALVSTNIELYPNPATDYFKIDQSGLDQTLTVTILDISGREVKNLTTDSSSNIDISNLQSGIYLVQIESGENSCVKKLVVK